MANNKITFKFGMHDDIYFLDIAEDDSLNVVRAPVIGLMQRYDGHDLQSSYELEVRPGCTVWKLEQECFDSKESCVMATTQMLLL